MFRFELLLIKRGCTVLCFVSTLRSLHLGASFVFPLPVVQRLEEERSGPVLSLGGQWTVWCDALEH